MKQFVFISIILMIGACSREDKICLKKAGAPSEKSEVLEAFDTIVLNDHIDLHIHPSTENKISIKAGENLIPTVKYPITSNTLDLSVNAGCNWYRDYDKNKVRVDLYTDGINMIRFYGSGNIVSEDTLKGQTLEVEAWETGGNVELVVDVDTMKAGIHTGPCDIIVGGRCNQGYSYCGGSGKIDCRNLEADEAHVHNGGTNDIYVWCDTYMDIQIYSIGNIYYKGNPSNIKQTITGTGELFKLN